MANYLVLIYDDKHVLKHGHPILGGLYSDLDTAVTSGFRQCALWEFRREEDYRSNVHAVEEDGAPYEDRYGHFRVVQVVNPTGDLDMGGHEVVYDSIENRSESRPKLTALKAAFREM